MDATAGTGLAEPSRTGVDKITTTPRDNVRERFGHPTDADLLRLDRLLIVFAGFG